MIINMFNNDIISTFTYCKCTCSTKALLRLWRITCLELKLLTWKRLKKIKKRGTKWWVKSLKHDSLIEKPFKNYFYSNLCIS